MKIFPKTTKYVDGVDGTLRQLVRKLPKELTEAELHGQGTVEYYFSGNRVTDNEMYIIKNYLAQLDRVEE